MSCLKLKGGQKYLVLGFENKQSLKDVLDRVKKVVDKSEIIFKQLYIIHAQLFCVMVYFLLVCLSVCVCCDTLW